MADSSQGSGQTRLPIKLIMPKQGTERKVMGGGSTKKPFRDVTRAYRNGLLNQVNAVEQALSASLKSLRAAPVRVTVIAKASAKSHRPDNLFSDKTCPIIGAGALGELFVKVTPDGLTALKSIMTRIIPWLLSSTAVSRKHCRHWIHGWWAALKMSLPYTPIVTTGHLLLDSSAGASL